MPERRIVIRSVGFPPQIFGVFAAEAQYPLDVSYQIDETDVSTLRTARLSAIRDHYVEYQEVPCSPSS